MPTSLSRLPRLLQRLALFGLVWLALVSTAGTIAAPTVGEGSAEETVHAAQDDAASLGFVVPGPGGDDESPDAAVCAIRGRAAVPPAAASTVPTACRTNVPASPARFLPAARGPPPRA